MEEAKIVFDLWKPLKQADKAKKLAGGKAKAAMEERKRRVANELSAICGSTNLFRRVFRGVPSTPNQYIPNQYIGSSSTMPDAGRKAVAHFGHNSVTARLQVIERGMPEGGLELSSRPSFRKLRVL
jgi:hypothetical protein